MPALVTATPLDRKPLNRSHWGITTQYSSVFTGRTLVKVPVIPPRPIRALQNNPVRLVIPSIAINAIIEHVGLTPGGAMGTPQTLSDVAWFDPGIAPGQIGTSVIDGHLDWTHGEAAVFANLYKLHNGANIQVVDASGSLTTFIVTNIGTFGENENTDNIFNSSDGISHLNLITCDGAWNSTSQSYTDRLVIFSDKVN